MARLNYHHLYYFWRVARSGNLTRTAAELHTSQSAVSSQIRKLEQTMDVQLFERRGRYLKLTRAGQQALQMANDIFSKGEELEMLLRNKQTSGPRHLRIGAVSTMSRNFIETLVAPLLREKDIQFTLTAKGITNLLNDLSNHQLDVVLANVNVAVNSERLWQIQLLARQPLSIIGPVGGQPLTTFPEGYERARWVLPGYRSEVRAAFDAFCSRRQYEPDIQAEVDDMAMLRLLARDSGALAVMPKVVVKDEIAAGLLQEYMTVPNAFEHFYAITLKRSYQPDLLTQLLAHHQWQ